MNNRRWLVVAGVKARELRNGKSTQAGIQKEQQRGLSADVSADDADPSF